MLLESLVNSTIRSREGSADRMTRKTNSSPSGVALDGWKPAPPSSHHHHHHHHLLQSQAPPPLPPRLHSPISTNGHSSSSSMRYVHAKNP